MSKSLECANMILDTGYQTSPQTTSISTVRTFNVNLRQILGDMYDQYETFAICLNSVTLYSQISTYNALQPSVGSFGLTATAKVGMSGLNWISSTTNGANTTLSLFPGSFEIGGGVVANDGGYGIANFKNPNCIMFSKPPQDNVSLTVGLYQTRGGGFIRAGNSAGETRLQLNYNFSIFGIYDE